MLSAFHAPDGKSVLIVTRDSKGYFCDAASGKVRGAPVTLGASQTSMSQPGWLTFSPDGQRALVAAWQGDGKAQLWDAARVRLLREAATGRKAWRMTFHAGAADRRFHPGGKTVLVEEEAGLSLWETAGGKTVRRLADKQSTVLAASFTADGESIVAALAGKDRCEVRRWDSLTGAPAGEALVLKGKVGFARFSPDTTVLATVESPEEDEHARTVKLWSTRTGKLRHSLAVMAGECVFSPDGECLLTSLLGEGTTDLWDVASGRRRGGPWRGVVWSAFSPDGRTLLTTGHRDGRLWDVATGRLRGQPIPIPFARACFSRDGRSLVVEDEKKGAVLVDVGTVKPLAPPLGRRALLDAGHDGSVLLVDESFRLVGRRRLPVPLHAEDERILLWVQVATGNELSPDGAMLEIDAATWAKRAERLKELGGPP